MKKAALFLAIAFCSFHLFAQDYEDEKTFKFGIGGTISIPVGDLKEPTVYGAGFEVLGVYNLTESIAAFAQAGFECF